jgi:cytochrome c6
MRKALLLSIGLLMAGVARTQAADVKENWTKHCAKCHGEDGKGQTSAGKRQRLKDYTDPKAQEKFTDEQAFKITKEGKKEHGRTVMKPFADLLTDQEIKDLVAHIRKFKK